MSVFASNDGVVAARPSFMRGCPSYLLPLTLLTGTYLTFELAFNARLLDVSGGLATVDEVDVIEHCGRFISGIALVLGIWGMKLMPMGVARRWPVGSWFWMLSIAAAIGITAVFFAEKALIDGLTAKSTGEQRRIAAQLTLLSHAILKQQVKVDGIDLNPEQLNTPEGKSFVALFPVLAYSTNDLERKADVAMREVIRTNVVAAMGSPEDFYNKTYRESVRKMADGYNKYVDGLNEMNRTLEGIPDRQRDAWADYLKSLREHRYTPTTVPRMGWPRVRRDVQAKGVPVGSEWEPSDRASFDAAIRSKVEAEASRRYRSSIDAQFGAGAAVPVNLTYEQFLAQPAIQRKWREGLKIRDAGAVLKPKMTVKEYSAISYDPQLDKAVEDTVRKYKAEAASFDVGGANQEVGEQAMRALLVPPIALGFSLIGAMVHLAKFSLCLVRFISSAKKWNRIVVIGSIITIMLSALLAPNAISGSRVFTYFQAQTRNQLGWIAERSLTWVVQAQPYGYPINEWVRKRILGDISYGYHPGAPREVLGAEE